MPLAAKKKKPDRKAPATLLPIQLVPLSKIDPSPQNRDASVELDSLVASIKQHGLQQPIKLRPKGDRFQIVYGERRWRACKELQHKEIPATIETLSDEEAEERRVLENAQRADPHALEEAEAYERLLGLKDTKGQPLHTPESIAKLTGRSVGTVYNRLKLTALAPELRKALYKNELTLTGAFLIARGIPTVLQAEAWEKMKAYAEETYEEELDDEERLTARTIQNLIDADYSRRLDNPVFSLKDKTLVPTAGSCNACPKRSSNQPQLFADTKDKDICTDHLCFQQKVTAYIEREKQRVLSIGGRALTEEESRRLFNGGTSLAYNSPWIDLDIPCYDDAERRTWRKLLGDLCPPPVLAFTSQAKPVLLAKKAEILETLKAHGLDPESLRAARRKDAPTDTAGAASHPDDPDEDDDDLEDVEDDLGGPAHPSHDPATARFEADVQRTTRQQIIAALVAAAENASPDDNRFVQLVYETMLHGGYHNALGDAVKRRLGNKRPAGEHVTKTIDSHVRGLTPSGLRALVLEIAISRSAYFVSGAQKYSDELARGIDLFGIDAASIEKTVSDELGAKRAARLAKAKPRSA